jgi:ABC-type antimicrobial peptide transport system permease subunit
MKTIVTWRSVVIEFGVSAAVCGLYPAKAAAALDLIEALRHG